MKLKPQFAALALALAAMGTVGVSAIQPAYAARTSQMDKIENVPFPSNVTNAQAEQAVLSSLSSRGWTVSKPSGGKVDATYARRDYSATITVTYSKSSFTITYKDSTGLDYDAAKNKIHSNYNKWVNNLKLDILRIASNAANGIPS